jgi:hypothetical protein
LFLPVLHALKVYRKLGILGKRGVIVTDYFQKATIAPLLGGSHHNTIMGVILCSGAAKSDPYCQVKPPVVINKAYDFIRFFRRVKDVDSLSMISE